MKSIWLLLLTLLFAGHTAAADTVDGSGALALAGLIADASPLVSLAHKDMLSKLLDGHADFSFPSNEMISVAAENLTCRASNVDIKLHACEVKFGNHDVVLNGRRAHELFATLAEVGVTAEGAAGSIHEGISNLHCTIDPNEIKQNSGDGAHCQYAPD